MSKKEDDMNDMMLEINELLESMADKAGLSKEKIDRLKKTAQAQKNIAMIIAELTPDEAAQVVLGTVVSLVVSYSDNVDEAAASLAKMQAAAMSLVIAFHSEKDDDDDDDEDDREDFPVEHKTKQ